MQRLVIDVEGLDAVLSVLKAEGYRTVGPIVKSDALAYDDINSAQDFPRGYTDEQKAGQYRLRKTDTDGYFNFVVGPQSLKNLFHKPRAVLCEVTQKNGQVTFVSAVTPQQKLAVIGARPCEIAAMLVQDKIFSGGEYRDPRYLSHRQDAFIVTVNCTRPGGTCFCASMDTGPKAAAGFDLALTELVGESASQFVVDVGSERGSEILAKVPHRQAGSHDTDAADKLIAKAAQQMGLKLNVENVKSLLQDNHDHAQWKDVESRCMSCGNCTFVCPTCFCSAVEDVSDLDGHAAKRVRRWESCFSRDFTYIHGGYVRQSGASRYRHWLTHKLANWHDQFGCSGCVGCGRCITWCPVGISIIDEVQAIRQALDHRKRVVEETVA
jgi:sulfhydrogenase subunit beta (sulfur reductase)